MLLSWYSRLRKHQERSRPRRILAFQPRATTLRHFCNLFPNLTTFAYKDCARISSLYDELERSDARCVQLTCLAVHTYATTKPTDEAYNNVSASDSSPPHLLPSTEACSRGTVVRCRDENGEIVDPLAHVVTIPGDAPIERFGYISPDKMRKKLG